MRQVAICTNGNVWGVDANNDLWYRTIITDDDDKGTEWTKDSDVSGVKQISCGKAGQFAWVDEASSVVVIKNEVTADDPAGLEKGSTQLTGIDAVGCTVSEQGQLYALGSDGVIYLRTGRTDDNLSGDGWEGMQDQEFKQMDAGNNELFAVSRWNEVYQRQGLVWNSETDNNKIGDGWKMIPGWMIYVSTAEEGIVWAIDVEHDVWVLETGTITLQEIIENENHGWTLIPEEKLV